MAIQPPRVESLNAVGIVADGVAPSGEFPLQFLARNPRFNAGLEVVLVERDNPVHAPHINRGEDAAVVSGQGQRAADVGAAAVGHETHIVLGSEAHDGADVIFTLWIKHQIDHALQVVAVEQAIDLINAELTVAVDQALRVVERHLLCPERVLPSGDETCVCPRGRHVLHLFFDRHLVGVNRHLEHLFDKGDEVRHGKTSQRIAATRNPHRLRPVELKAGICVAPLVRMPLSVGKVVGRIGHSLIS